MLVSDVRVGVIRTGVMGKNHVRLYSEFKEVEKLYVFDANKENANKMRSYGAIICDSLDALLECVDAVSICVPTKYHFEVAKKVVKKGISCLIEKPFTLTAREGEELLNDAKNRSSIIGIGHIERFNPIVNEIKKIVMSPLYVEIKRHNPDSARITDATIIEDLMIHDIDIVFNVLFGEQAHKIYAVGNSDLCKSLVTFNNSVVSLSASRLAFKKIRTIYIEDKNFTIEGDFMAQEIYVYKKPKRFASENERYVQENIIEKVLVNKVEPLRVELKTFIDCVVNRTVFPVTPVQALNNVLICEEIKKCL